MLLHNGDTFKMHKGPPKYICNSWYLLLIQKKNIKFGQYKEKIKLLTNCKHMRWHCPKRFSLIWLYCFWRIYFRYVKVRVHCNQNVGNICLNRKSINIKFSNYYFHLKLSKAYRRKKTQQTDTFYSLYKLGLPNLHFKP